MNDNSGNHLHSTYYEVPDNTLNAFHICIHLILVKTWELEWGVISHGFRFSFWGDKDVLKLDCGDGCTNW